MARIFAWLSLLLAIPSASAEAPVWESIAVYPPEIHLATTTDLQHVIVVATRSDGVTQDVTEKAKYTMANPRLASWSDYILKPTADGDTNLDVEWKGLKVSASIHVNDATKTRDVSFTQDVMPILTRSSCNNGSCHGAARGKDGFRLSLFGFDPKSDYERITHEVGIRRINLARPEQSLILLKATGAVQHTGGKRVEPDSEHYKTLLSWLANGANGDKTAPPIVAQVDLYPKEAVLEGEGNQQRMVAVAKYADGTTRDVGDLAAFTTNNERSAEVSPAAVINSGVRGEAYVMARFDTHTVGSQVIALPKDASRISLKAANNYIDKLVGEKLEKLRVQPSELCTDEEFLRRATIDIVGVLPTIEEYTEFTAEMAGDKRKQLVDRLLERQEFSEIWAMKWADLLMIKTINNLVSPKAAFLYNTWLTEKIAANEPIDEIFRELLSASGTVFENPPTNFYQIERDRLKLSENVAQIFMGVRTQCAQCHNHPFDRWTMDDYYGFAAFFSQLGRKQGEDYREMIVYNSGTGEMKHPVGGATVAPKFLGGEKADVVGKDRRVVMADWITSPDNPYFAKSVVNRVWAHFTGVGIVNPVDDFRVSNPASNPELLDELATKLRDYKFDFKQLVRDICNSDAYQRSATPNETNDTDLRNYSHAQVRRVPAESLLDCISQATNTKNKFRGLPLGSRAVQIADGTTSNYFLTTFGRSPRDTVCACEATTDPSLSQALHMVNGDNVGGKISQGQLIKEWRTEKLEPAAILEHIFVRSLARKPTANEQTELLQFVEKASDPQVGWEDVFWAVLNSREFIFNH
ncbi:MAG: DUF1549 and DUF1553 domain-containing protein [Pirellulaceae bacterium]|nr:DUF1549 and DUF1553 domain-containing protein [Pirellulaceae bacterium]